MSSIRTPVERATRTWWHGRAASCTTCPGRYDDKRIVVIGHSATKWAFDHILEGIPLDELVEGSFRWQPGWLYTLAVDA